MTDFTDKHKGKKENTARPIITPLFGDKLDKKYKNKKRTTIIYYDPDDQSTTSENKK
jgi:hypothetical protein